MNLINHIFSVSELNSVIKTVLEDSFPEINLEGEITNFRPASSGHWYFSLRDRDSIISSVMFRNVTNSLNFKPENGMKVKVKGKLSLYSQRGTYQIICNSMIPFGEGDILLMLEKRKREYAAKGYFDPENKTLIPRFPKKIGVITSPTGAAIRDFLKIIKRRLSISDIVILPTLVQGSNAGKQIENQIERANRIEGLDLIIVTRGGGSLEDLLPFSDECVVEAIFKSKIPVISAVGHEIDNSLSDLVADLRVATPSAAGEIVTEGTQNLYLKIEGLKSELKRTVDREIFKVKSKLSLFNKEYVKKELEGRLNSFYMHLDSLKRDLLTTGFNQIKTAKNRVKSYKDILNSISPLTLLEKGYSWVSYKGKSINSVDIKPDDIIDIRYEKDCIKGKIL